MTPTLFPLPKDLFGTLLEAQSEADVKQAVVAELPLGRLEYLQTDYIHDNLLIEFKFDNDMSYREGRRAEVLAQTCYYCHYLRINGDRVPPYVALVDRNEVILYMQDISTNEERPHIFEIDATDGGKITLVYGSTTGAADEIIRTEFNFNGEIGTQKEYPSRSCQTNRNGLEWEGTWCGLSKEEFSMHFRLGELFCGPGGIGYAAITADIGDPRWKIVHAWANDYDEDTCETFARNVAKETESVVCRDIRKLNYNKLKKISEIDALAFGFPCNDFSVVGEQKGMDGIYGPLYEYGIKGLKHFKPKWFLAENVGGLRNSNDGNAFQTILEEMYKAGYSVYPHLYKFEEYGVPQARHRIIIVGIRKDQNVVFQIPSTKPYINKRRKCREAIETPPIPDDAPNHDFTRQTPDVVARLRYIKPGENAFTADIPEHLQLKIRGVKISQIYRRLEPDKPAYTITGSGGGGTHVYHWSEDRALTNRERARLQTFPDDFIFYGSKESVRKQIGMAVPVDGVRIIFEAVLKSFAGIAYESDLPAFTPSIWNNCAKQSAS